MTAHFYLALTLLLSLGLFAAGVSQWRFGLIIGAGLCLMIVANNSSLGWLAWLTIWSVCSAVLFMTHAPILTVLLCTLSAISYILAPLGVAQVIASGLANVLGLAMLASLVGGGIHEHRGAGPGSSSILGRLLDPSSGLAWVRAPKETREN